MEMVFYLFLDICLFSLYTRQVFAECMEEYLPHGKVTLKKEPYHTVHYECDEGYELFGQPDAYCFGGVWITPVPVCHAKGCNPVGYTSVVNGDISVLSENSLLMVTCNPGFIMDGESMISCDGQQWSEPLPHCYSATDITSCNFEHHSLCGWIQDETHNGDWLINSRETDTKRTGPKFDHTLGPEKHSGHYIYMESSVPSKYGHYSRLLSPVFPRQKSRRCFQIWYHMLGPEEPGYMGKLEIFLRLQTGLNHIEKQLFIVSGNKGDEWHKAEVFIELQDSDFQIVVQATRGLSHTADIAVDDFSFYKCTNDSDIDISQNEETTNSISEEHNDTAFVESYNINLNESSEVSEVTVTTPADSQIFIKESNIEKIKAQHMPSTPIPGINSSVIYDNTTSALKSMSTTERTVTRPTTPEFIIYTRTNDVKFQKSMQTAYVQKKNFVVYPADFEQSSEQISANKRAKVNHMIRQDFTTLSPEGFRSNDGGSILRKPMYIAIISGVCVFIVLAVVTVSVIIYRRRSIWGRKSSDDQSHVLYRRSLNKVEISQKV